MMYLERVEGIPGPGSHMRSQRADGRHSLVHDHGFGKVSSVLAASSLI